MQVFGTQKLLAAAINDMLGEPTPPREDISINVLGINHFTWLDAASWQGQDLFPLYREFADKHYTDGWKDKELENWMTKDAVFRSRHRVKFDLFRRFGLIAAAGDRHLAEFMPASWYLKNPGSRGGLGFWPGFRLTGASRIATSSNNKPNAW